MTIDIGSANNGIPVGTATIGNGGGSSFKVEVVSELPVSGQTGILYLVPVTADPSGDNTFKEYIWLDDESRYEELGFTDIDLSGYVTDEELKTSLEEKQDKLQDSSSWEVVKEYPGALTQSWADWDNNPVATPPYVPASSSTTKFYKPFYNQPTSSSVTAWTLKFRYTFNFKDSRNLQSIHIAFTSARGGADNKLGIQGGNTDYHRIQIWDSESTTLYDSNEAAGANVSTIPNTSSTGVYEVELNINITDKVGRIRITNLDTEELILDNPVTVTDNLANPFENPSIFGVNGGNNLSKVKLYSEGLELIPSYSPELKTIGRAKISGDEGNSLEVKDDGLFVSSGGTTDSAKLNEDNTYTGNQTLIGGSISFKANPDDMVAANINWNNGDLGGLTMSSFELTDEKSAIRIGSTNATGNGIVLESDSISLSTTDLCRLEGATKYKIIDETNIGEYLGEIVTLDTAQTITGNKTFEGNLNVDILRNRAGAALFDGSTNVIKLGGLNTNSFEFTTANASGNLIINRYAAASKVLDEGNFIEFCQTNAEAIKSALGLTT